MEPLLLFPDPPPAEVVQAIELAAMPWKSVGAPEPADGWSGAVIAADADPEGAFALCRSLRKRDVPFEPVLLLVNASQLADLELRDDLFDDFCLTPIRP